MTGTSYTVTAKSSTTQTAKHGPCWSSHDVRKPPRAATAKHSAPAFHTCKTPGRAWKQKLDVSCHTSWQDQPVKQEGPSISRLDPALQQQWDHAVNAHLGPIDIKPYSNRKVWWTCDQCPDGHIHTWKAIVSSRTKGRGCPQRSGRKVCKHNSLATKAPRVAAQWDYKANSSTPDSVVAQSSKPVWWLCDICGNKWRSAPCHRVSRQTGCPKYAQHPSTKKQVKHPTFADCQDPRGKALDLLAEWDHERNRAQGHFPHNTRLRSNKHIFWLCHKCPAGKEHSWSAMPQDRTGRQRTGCPFCAGKAACKCNSLQALYPDIAAEWDYAKNEGKPSDYTARSCHQAWWLNPQRGSWQRRIDSRTDPRVVCNRPEQ